MPVVPAYGATENRYVELLASAARTASGTGSAVELKAAWTYLGVELIVTAAAAAVGDTLNVYLQQSIDDGTNWDDVASFTQVLGNGGVLAHIASILRAGGLSAGEMHQATDATLAAGTIRAQISARKFRIKWTIAGATPNFTFQVIAMPRTAP